MDRAAGATSQFATSLIDLLDRVHYRRVSVQEQFDPVYRLRYEAYRREDFIPINSQQITRDKFDDAPNCHCFGIYIDDRLVSSIRLHAVSAEQPTSPSRLARFKPIRSITDCGMRASLFPQSKDGRSRIPKA